MESMWIAIRTYSIFPVPDFEWNEKNMRYSLSFLPVVGVLIGAVLYLWQKLNEAVPPDGIFFAAVCTAIPLILTGGIHMDGFMDTADAIGSHRSREEKLSIMKDPHCGSAAVLWCVLYILISFGLMHAMISSPAFPVICGSFVLSRALTVIGAMTIPNARGNGFLFSFTEHTRKTPVLFSAGIPACLAGGFMLLMDGRAGGLGIVFALLSFFFYRRSMRHLFGGVTGDTSGFFIQTCELMTLFGVWLGGIL